jgi:flagellar hook-basal body complex protein FliE
MTNLAIGSLGSTELTQIGTKVGKTQAGSVSFGDLLTSAISETSKLQTQSAQEVEKLMTGEVQDVHTALIAVQKADLSFQMMMQVKNKLMAAYDDVMRMQV